MATENFDAPGVSARVGRAAVPVIQASPVSIGGFIMYATKGPHDKAVRVDSFAKFVRIFGSYDTNTYGPDAVRAFFDNGGRACWIVRITRSGGSGSNVKATFTLQSAALANTMVCTAVGYGVSGNGMKVVAAKEDTKLGLIGAVTATGAQTVINCSSAIAAKLRVGDQIAITEGTTQRGIVSRIDDTKIILVASVTVPAGGYNTTTTIITKETFSITVYDQGVVVAGPYRNLAMSSLSLKDYFLTRLNTTDDENPVTFTDSGLSMAGGVDTRPVNTVSGGDMLVGGSEMTQSADADYKGSSATSTGVYAFDKVASGQVNILAIPGVTGTSGAVSKALVEYCAGREDVHCVISPALATAVSAAVTYKQDNIGAYRFGAMYYPWVQILDPISGQPAYVPPDGYVMGLYARTDRKRGVQKAPAGEAEALVGTIGVERKLSRDDRGTLYTVNINPIEDIAGKGQCVMGSRTLEKGLYGQVSVSRTYTYLAVTLREGTRWVIFEPNNEDTRARLRRSVSDYLEREWRKNLLNGDTVDQAFYCICDASNNPDVIVKAQQMVADVGVNVPDVTENLVINISQDQRGSSAAA